VRAVIPGGRRREQQQSGRRGDNERVEWVTARASSAPASTLCPEALRQIGPSSDTGAAACIKSDQRSHVLSSLDAPGHAAEHVRAVWFVSCNASVMSLTALIGLCSGL